MTRAGTAAAVTGTLAAIFMPAAEAQRLNCAPRDVVTTTLSDKHGERPTLRGMVGNVMLEVWLADSGSFSIVLTQASNGLACMLGAGTSMHHVPPPKSGKKS